MLKYLMKYDLLKILKFLIWFYLISLFLACVSRILNIFNNIQLIKIIATVFESLTYSAIGSIIINTFIHILLRFSTSFFKDQSYLTHTLPVKKDTLILSKYLSSLIVTLLSGIVSFLSLFIIFYSPEFILGIKTAINSIVFEFNLSSGLFVFLFIILILSQICSIMSIAFLSIIKGYSYNHKRGVKGFLWFAIYYIACMITTLLLIIIVNAIAGNISSLFVEKLSSGVFLTILILAIVAYIAYSFLFFLLCKKEFRKGVNVD